MARRSRTARRRPDPGRARALARRALEQADASFRAGNLVAAEAACRTVLEASPGDARGLQYLAVVLQRMGRAEEAIACLREALEAESGDPAAHNNLGNLLRERGRDAEAIACYRAALALAPRHANAWFNLGVALQRVGDHAEALVAFERLLEIGAGDQEIWARLGRCQRLARRPRDAVRSLERAVAGGPHDPVLEIDLAGACRESGDAAGAVRRLEVLIESRPELAAAHHELGWALWALGRRAEAERAAARAVELDPALAGARLGLAQMRLHLARPEAARAALGDCPDRDARDVPALLLLSRLELAEGNVGPAAAAAERALELDPGSASAHCRLAKVRLDEGRLEAAGKLLERALALDPGEPESWHTHALTHRFTAADRDRVRHVEGLLGREDLAEEARATLHFALGKMHDDLDDATRAFDHYLAGNRIQRALLDYSAADHERLVDAVIEGVDRALLARFAGGTGGERALFIVGMPRSGTTLLEQFLAAHSRVHAGGELVWIPDTAARLERETGAPYPACLLRAGPAAVAAAGTAHVERLHALAPGAALVTDKLPGNYLYVGLVAAMLPGARFVHCRRHPLDVCVSNFVQLYEGGHAYSYDLGELGHAYRQHARLMAHWRALLPGRVHEVRYEALVAEPEPTVRAALAFCGLDWEEACRDHRAGARAVHTASQVQVRQAVYRSSVERWRRYGSRLGELQAALADDEG